MLWLEKKYINQVSNQLERFRWVRDNVANFRCPVCGDSQKNTRKSRGYLYVKDNKFFFHCKNNECTGNIHSFLKNNFPATYNQFIIEHFKETRQETPKKPVPLPQSKKPVFVSKPKELWIPVNGTFAEEYLRGRRVPANKWSRLGFVANFEELANQLQQVEDAKYPSDPRLVLPIYDRNHKLVAVQGRSLEANASLRYSTIKLDPTSPLLFGAEAFNENELGLCVEGPIDSLFLPNCVAAVGTNINHIPKNCIVLLDNEPRKPKIVRKYEQVIDSGYKICIWNGMETCYKDINEMVLGGISIKQILKLVLENTYSGLDARVRLLQWKKS